MSTPSYLRKPAKLDALKKAKILEEYTIKKVCNEKQYSKKKYRRFLTTELVKLATECYTFLLKSYHTENPEKAYLYADEAYLSISALEGQLNAANELYESSIPNLEYWAELIVDVEESIELWKKHIQKQ